MTLFFTIYGVWISDHIIALRSHNGYLYELIMKLQTMLFYILGLKYFGTSIIISIVYN